MPNAKTKPPITAVRRVDFLRHKEIIIGAENIDTAQLAAPNHPVLFETFKNSKERNEKRKKKIKKEGRKEMNKKRNP